MIGRKELKELGVIVLLFVLVAAALLIFQSAAAFRYPFGRFLMIRERYPAVEKTIIADLDKNGHDENYSLKQGKLIVTQDNKQIWKSDDAWWIEDFALADSDNDGKTELNMSAWKSGDYGKIKPFWVEQDDLSVKNHFFVFGYINGALKPKWQSSNLSKPNCEFAFVNLNGEQYLAVIEGEYEPDFKCHGKYLALWKWQEWGFVNEWRSVGGNYSGIQNYLAQFPEISQK